MDNNNLNIQNNKSMLLYNPLEKENTRHRLLKGGAYKGNAFIVPKNLPDKFSNINTINNSFVPATREWKHSVYSYNKNNIKTALFKNKMLAKRMKSYFNLTHSSMKTSKSKRMRNLIKRSSIKRIFVSKPEIKETNDKVNITLYTVNNEKKEYNRKIALTNKTYADLNKYNISLLKNYIALRAKNIKASPLNNSTYNSTNSKLILDNNLFNALDPNIEALSLNKNHDFYSVTNKSKIYFVYSYEKKKSLAINYRKEALFFGYKLRKGIKFFNSTVSTFNENRQKSKTLVSNQIKKELIHKQEKSWVNRKLNLYAEISNKSSLTQGDKNPIVTRLSQRIMRNAKDLINKKQFKNKKLNVLFLTRFKRFSYKNKKFFKKNLIRLLRKQEKKNLKNKIPYYHFNKLIKTLPFAFSSTKINIFKSKFMLNFMLWSLASFGINIIINKKNNIIIANKSKEQLDNANFEKLKSLLTQTSKKDFKTIIPSLNLFSNTYIFKFNKMMDIHIILWRILNIVLLKATPFEKIYTDQNGVLTKNLKEKAFIDNKINYLFKQFKNKFLKVSVNDVLKKELLAITYLYILTTTRFKFTKFLDSIKSLISKIYAKKVELNLVNLKYIHLNSSILLEAISIKLKNKKNNLLQVMKKALKLIKLPSKIKSEAFNEDIYNNTIKTLTDNNKLKSTFLTKNAKSSIDNFKGEVSYTKDDYQEILIKIFKQTSKDKALPSKYYEKNSKLSLNIPKLLYKMKDRKNHLLKTLKYKWVTGARIQGSGRLTRRFTASRALFKDRIKGHLKDLHLKNFRKSKMGNKAPSILMLRNQVIPNVEHSLGKAKRRIGAFGVNVWISSN